MAVATYTLAQYVDDLRRITAETRDDRDIMDRVRPLAQRLALDRSWLEPRFYEGDQEQGFSVYLLHEEPDHRLAVFVVSWLPGGGTAPADGYLSSQTSWRRQQL